MVRSKHCMRPYWRLRIPTEVRTAMQYQLGHKGYWFGKKRNDPAYLQKLSLAMKGRKGFWAGKKRDDPVYIEKISLAHKGQDTSHDTRFKKGQVSARKGKHFPQIAGDKHYDWQGGISPESARIRHTIEMRVWRETVMRRDNWMCQACSKRDSDLHAHHIQPFSKFPDLRFTIHNGITLCKPCHRYAHKNIARLEAV